MRTLIKGGTLVTAADTYKADLLIQGEQIAAIGEDLSATGADEVIEATGFYVMPGAVDPHTHLDIAAPHRGYADDYTTGSIAAACGGTTTVIDFIEPVRGQRPREDFESYHGAMQGKMAVDYSLHGTLVDAGPQFLEDMRWLVDRGITSFKLYLAYRGYLMVSDETFFRACQAAGEVGALVCVHAENGDVIEVLRERYLKQGLTEPQFHALSRPPETEGEATFRALTLATLAQCPVYVVHMSSAAALQALQWGRECGAVAYGETCPQYLLLDLSRYQQPDGAKYVMSPPLREAWNCQALWDGIVRGQIQTVGTDHCAFFYEVQKAGRARFPDIANGIPGIETRLYLLFSEGVVKGRITPNRFVDLVSTMPARIFGLYPRKGTIAIGSDADLVLWDPSAKHILSASALHQRTDYCPYEGFEVHGAIRRVLLRGRTIVEGNNFVGEVGFGRFQPRKAHRAAVSPIGST
jgi:dihydropyrimidinase